MNEYKRLINRAFGMRAKITFENIKGQSKDFGFAVKCAQIAAQSDSSVLLLGESGVGKEMFAQAIHNASQRAREPFVAINCAALPRELVSSELFGYEEGAFTGARKGGSAGKLELADQGTIFLDEIGEMPLDIQGTLLRFLDQGTIVRLGGNEQIPVDVRIIAATNKNLSEEVDRGNFRLDLYYRLGVIDLTIPPLRERRDDIPELVHHFIQTISPKLGKVIAGVEDEAMALLLRYHWPGNVRELSNTIERSINMSVGDMLTIDSLPPALRMSAKKPAPAESMTKNPTHIDHIDEQMLRKYLGECEHNRSLAAQKLGISRSTLYRIMKKYGMV